MVGITMHRIKIAHFLRTKNFYSLSLFFGILLLTTATIKIVRAKIEADAHTPSPKNTAILWDVDGVILIIPEGCISAALWKHKAALAQGAINPILLLRGIWLLINSAAGGQYQALFKEKYPKLALLTDEIMRSKKLNPGAAKLIKEIHAQRYSQHIVSNIDSESYASYEPDIDVLQLMKSATTITYSSDPAKKTIKKPNPVFFHQVIEKLRTVDPEKTMLIFIDDNEKNIKAAQDMGIKGILYKNDEQARQELCELGILTGQTSPVTQTSPHSIQ